MRDDEKSRRSRLLSFSAARPWESSTWRMRDQFFAFGILSVGMAAMTRVLGPAADIHFRRFLGSANPLLAVAAAAVIGGGCLAFLRSCGRFEILKGPGTLRGMAFSAVAAALFAVAVIMADLILRYPEDMNVALPEALLYYPAIGFIAEIAFHVLPLAIALLLVQPLRKRIGGDRILLMAMAVAAATEPSFQVIFARGSFSFVAVHIWIHVFLIACAQLYLFRRFDFVSMYSFRLFYYAGWHIIWGTIRLEFL